MASNGNVLAVWQDNRFPPSYGTWTAVSVTGGASWNPDLQLSPARCHPLWLRCEDLEATAVWMAPDLAAPPHFVEAAMSLDAGLTWFQSFAVSANSGDADRAVLAWNRLYTNFPIAWLADGLEPITHFNDVYAGGFRPQTLTPVGDFTVAGSPVSFQVSGWPQADRGKSFGVVVSYSLGNYTISDGRNTGLVRDALFNQALQNIPGLLSGTIDPFGNGSTPTFPVPALTGTIYAAAGAFLASPRGSGLTLFGGFARLSLLALLVTGMALPRLRPRRARQEPPYQPEASSFSSDFLSDEGQGGGRPPCGGGDDSPSGGGQQEEGERCSAGHGADEAQPGGVDAMDVLIDGPAGLEHGGEPPPPP